MLSIEHVFLSLKKDIESIEKYYVKAQWRNIYEVVDCIFFGKTYYFISGFLKQRKYNTNVLQDISKETKYIIKQISLVGGFHS